jgi:hypothetical protein
LLPSVEFGIDHGQRNHVQARKPFDDDLVPRIGRYDYDRVFAGSASEDQISAIEAVRKRSIHITKEQASSKDVAFEIPAPRAELAELRLGALDIDIDDARRAQLEERPPRIHARKIVSHDVV